LIDQPCGRFSVNLGNDRESQRRDVSNSGMVSLLVLVMTGVSV
jgi:hypothetical protein